MEFATLAFSEQSKRSTISCTHQSKRSTFLVDFYLFTAFKLLQPNRPIIQKAHPVGRGPRSIESVGHHHPTKFLRILVVSVTKSIESHRFHCNLAKGPPIRPFSSPQSAANLAEDVDSELSAQTEVDQSSHFIPIPFPVL